MSLSKTALEEYARQCTEQRRHYEDCLQQARQDNLLQEDKQPEAMTQEAEAHAPQPNHQRQCTEPSCMIELLGLPTDPLGWDDSDPVLDETRKVAVEAPQWQHDDTERSRHTEINSTGKSNCSVSYGAP